MFKFLNRIFGKSHAVEMVDAGYEKEREVATDGPRKDRLTLAKSSKTNQEILYYLAENDPDVSVRKAVALNTMTPVHASSVLVADDSADVRLALAERLFILLPDLDEKKQSRVYAYVVQALATLALDEVLKIRKALSSTLKDHAYTPPSVAGQLARDIERDVSEPILRFCVALPDEDLIDILQNYSADWVVEAIAGRETVSEPVSGAVIKTNVPSAGKILLENKGALISMDTLEEIVQKAKDFPEWQKPIALRKGLPKVLALKLIEYADHYVRDLLSMRDDFDDEIKEEISTVFRRRMDFAGDTARLDGESVKDCILRLDKEGRLDDKALSDALAMRDNDLAIKAIGHMSGVDDKTVAKIIKFGAAKPIVALCWKAGLSMRTALQIQKELGHIQPKDLMYPRNGIDYPLTEGELIWQLEFIGVK